ncbi:MAG: hypothetical protein ACMUEM_04440 [Flavobacteriales bacterium AspAUS03]
MKNTFEDDQLLPFLCRVLVDVEPVLKDRMIFVDQAPWRTSIW